MGLIPRRCLTSEFRLRNRADDGVVWRETCCRAHPALFPFRKAARAHIAKSPFVVAEFPSIDAVKRVCNRAVLVRFVYQLFAAGATYDEVRIVDLVCEDFSGNPFVYATAALYSC